MGGLVIKRLYILAKQKAEFSSISDRVRALIFLATPHRGTDLSQLLARILNLSHGARPFVKDLHRNSLATQAINDEFPRYCQDLQLFSFYETEPTNLFVGKCFVVERDLATLGYANERTAYLTADHRQVCKYATKKDPNYITVRNALASIIDGFRDHVAPSLSDLDSDDQMLLDAFLGISATPEDDFMDVDHLRMGGSCEWIMRKSKYQEWQESANTQFYWISAKPATGKTVLSGMVVHHLRDLNRDCQFYFFDHGDKTKSSVSVFLLSMARQMALLHSEVLNAVLELRKKESQLKKPDYRTIWRVLYAECILHTKLLRPQFWVIDALDECQAGSELIPLLLKVMKELPVHIFLTSRDPVEAHSQHIPAGTKILSDEISRDDTQFDIKLYLERQMDSLPSGNDEERQAIKSQILKKADGCFLWVKLILDELRRVHRSTEIRQVLENVPSDMDALYSRILDSMSRTLQPMGKGLAKAILTWTVCAAQALTTEELKAAIQLHICDRVIGIGSAITSLCGQLVYVDLHHQRVHVVHQTVREYLFRAKNSEFAIDKHLGHRQLAMTCLEYLKSQDMASPTGRKTSLGASNVILQRSEFASYACNSFFEHLNHISPSIDGQTEPTYDNVTYALAEFLSSSNVLSWIEYIARHSDLKRLILAGQAIKHFLQKRSKNTYPYGIEFMLEHSCADDIIQSNFRNKLATMDSWATDLIRLVTKFGKNLLASPPSIYHLIPPFCPPESAIRKLFADSPSSYGISLVGLKDPTWGDCLSTIIDRSEQFAALACCSTQFAIGMVSGTIKVYNSTTCQEIKTLYHCHGEHIKRLKYGIWSGVLVSSGTNMVRVWDTKTWKQMYEFNIPAQCLALALADEDEFLLGALENNQLMLWDLTNGTLRNVTNWTADLKGQKANSFRLPVVAAFSDEECLLAVVYQGQDILLWDISRYALFEICPKETGARSSSNRAAHGGVVSLVFGAELTGKLLAAAYDDGDLVIFDTTEDKIKEMTLANAQILTASPDGRTLAAGDSSGTIQLYDFETLRLLYRLKSDDSSIRKMKFNADSLSLIDIRGSQCQIWDPMVLVRQDAEEELSDTVSISSTLHETRWESFEHDVLITSLACYGSSEIFFCGKQDGTVYLYEMEHGQQVKKLFSHADDVAITLLCFDDKSRLLSSVDSSNRVMMRRVFRQQKSEHWETDEPILDYEAGMAVDQILFNEGHTRVLVSSAMGGDTLWEISPEGNKIISSNPAHSAISCRWATHPLKPDQLILIADCTAHLYEWQTLQRLTPPEGIQLEANIEQGLTIRSIAPCLNGEVIAIAFGESSKRHCKSKLRLWNTIDFSPNSEKATVIPNYKTLGEEIDFLIGTDRQRLVFLHSDNWICSKDPELPDETVRHFFLPADWLTINNDLMIEIARPGREILFVKRDEVAVIKRSLVHDERGLGGPNLRRLSPYGKGRNSHGSMPATEVRDFFRNLRMSSDKKSPSLLQETTIHFEEEVERDGRINSLNFRRPSTISKGDSLPNDFSPTR
jgi:WD40 repeat protein